jgi:hypothetical protein
MSVYLKTRIKSHIEKYLEDQKSKLDKKNIEGLKTKLKTKILLGKVNECLGHTLRPLNCNFLWKYVSNELEIEIFDFYI